MGIFATFRGTSAPEELPLWAPSGQVALPLRNSELPGGGRLGKRPEVPATVGTFL